MAEPTRIASSDSRAGLVRQPEQAAAGLEQEPRFERGLGEDRERAPEIVAQTTSRRERLLDRAPDVLERAEIARGER
jgi:hypothetical protein